MEKFIMKNTKTGQYWCSSRYPQVCDDIWLASTFESSSQAQSALNALMAEKYIPADFKPVPVKIVEQTQDLPEK